MYINYLEKDISHTDRIPQIVRQQPGFYELIQKLCEYIDTSTAEIYNILSGVLPLYVDSDNMLLSYLQRLLNKSGINLKWMSATTDDSTLKQVYKQALLGLSVLRNTDSTRATLISTLCAAFNVSPNSITISENNSEAMAYTADINGLATTTELSYLANYVKPNITGTNSIIQFRVSDYFVSQKIENKVEKPLVEMGGNLGFMGIKSGKEVIIDDATNKDNNFNTGYWVREYK